MEKRFTFYAKAVAYTVLMFSFLAINSLTSKIYAQACSSSSTVFSEDFGAGISSVSNPDVMGLTFSASGPLANEGTYRVINDAQQKPEWHASEDGTPNNINGRMLVVNGIKGVFYIHRIDRPLGFLPNTYTANFFLMNVNTPGTCAPDPLLPVMTLRLEYLSETNTWVPFTGAPYTAPAVGQTIDPVWAGIGSTFILPETGTFLVKSVRLVVADETLGGCGNDFAIDNITVSQCSSSGTAPVTFLKVDARQKGTGINVDWSTSQEFNNKSFVVERSADGNSNWNVVATVNGAGNSSIVKNYSVFDPQPFKGMNFYRVKQVDIDGNFKYSKTVNLKFNINKTGISVLANPFHNTLTVNFSSSTNQVVSVRLADITGKQVVAEKWSISTGNTRKDFSNVSGLQQGMYIITVSGPGGEILYNNKVIKQ